MKINIPDETVSQLQELIDQQRISGAPVRIKNPQELVNFILTSVSKGINDQGSRERVLLEIMGLVPNAIVGDVYGTISETPAKIKLRERFWETYSKLEELADIQDSVNHSNDDDFIMINLNQFNTKCLAHSLKHFHLPDLKHALRGSKAPVPAPGPDRPDRQRTGGPGKECPVQGHR